MKLNISIKYNYSFIKLHHASLIKNKFTSYTELQVQYNIFKYIVLNLYNKKKTKQYIIIFLILILEGIGALKVH